LAVFVGASSNAITAELVRRQKAKEAIQNQIRIARMVGTDRWRVASSGDIPSQSLRTESAYYTVETLSEEGNGAVGLICNQPPHPQPFSPMAGRLESSLHNEFVHRPAKGEKGAKKAAGEIAFESRRSPPVGFRHAPISSSSWCQANANFLLQLVPGTCQFRAKGERRAAMPQTAGGATAKKAKERDL
jgi:hypothetical protein